MYEKAFINKKRYGEMLEAVNNIKNLIQLENGIVIDNKKIIVCLNEDEFDNLMNEEAKLIECEKMYVSSDILLSKEQEKKMENYNIELFIIPEYYFKDEIMEVTE